MTNGDIAAQFHRWNGGCMEKMRGIVNNVRHTASVSGGGDERSPITTTHISVFKIDGRQIRFNSNQPALINEGDNVFIAGNMSRGTFNALAYKNLTTCVEGSEGWTSMFLIGVAHPIVGIVVIGVFSAPFFGVFPKIVGSVFIAYGIYKLFRGTRVFQAVNELRQESP